MTTPRSPDRLGVDFIDIATGAPRLTLMHMYAFEVLDGVALVIPVHGDSAERAGRRRCLAWRAGTVGRLLGKS